MEDFCTICSEFEWHLSCMGAAFVSDLPKIALRRGCCGGGGGG